MTKCWVTSSNSLADTLLKFGFAIVCFAVYVIAQFTCILYRIEAFLHKINIPFWTSETAFSICVFTWLLTCLWNLKGFLLILFCHGRPGPFFIMSINGLAPWPFLHLLSDSTDSPPICFLFIPFLCTVLVVLLNSLTPVWAMEWNIGGMWKPMFL